MLVLLAQSESSTVDPWSATAKRVLACAYVYIAKVKPPAPHYIYYRSSRLICNLFLTNRIAAFETASYIYYCNAQVHVYYAMYYYIAAGISLHTLYVYIRCLVSDA